MADENRAEIDEAAVAALFSDWASPVGVFISALADAGEAGARAAVPRRTGTMAATIRVARVHDEVTGVVKGCVGAGKGAFGEVPHGRAWAAGFPYVYALDNTQGLTFNRGRRSARRLRPFLTGGALDAIQAAAASYTVPG